MSQHAQPPPPRPVSVFELTDALLLLFISRQQIGRQFYLRSFSLLTVSFFLALFQSLSNFLLTAAWSDSDMILQGKEIDRVWSTNSHPVSGLSSPTNSTKITSLYQKNKSFLVYFSDVNIAIDYCCCYYCPHWVIYLFTWHYYYDYSMALLAVAFYVVYITLDDVERPQTPFPVLNFLASEPETLSCLYKIM